MLHCFNSTRFKIRAAHLLFLVLKFCRLQSPRVVRRDGVFFEIDLSEGIDLSLFLFGSFQKHVTKSELFQLPEDAVILDIGANVGTVSLRLANQLPLATIYAFEPTEYAYGKLQKNLALNPNLQDRILPVKSFVASGVKPAEANTVFSSWRVDTLNGQRHPVHLGIAKKAFAKQTTVDHFVAENDLTRLDFIKIDTDGHELDVLKGAVNSLAAFHPVIIFELSTYLLKEQGQTFSDFEQILLPLGYNLIDSKTASHVTGHNVSRIVPKAGSADILALPGPDKGQSP